MTDLVTPWSLRNLGRYPKARDLPFDQRTDRAEKAVWFDLTR